MMYTAVIKLKKLLTKDIKSLFVIKNKNTFDQNNPVYKRISLSQNELSNFERYNELLIYDYYDVGLYNFKHPRILDLF